MLTHNKQDAGDKKTKEKRAYPRLVCHEPTFYSTKSGLYEGIIRNRDKEGVKGIFIATNVRLSIGEAITVAISSPGENGGKKLKGRIARRGTGGYAVKFTGHLNL